jgi:tRNA pseudouridine synthase 10
MGRMKRMSAVAVSRARRYQAKSFAVGVAVPEGVQEREDELRSTLKLKGSETIKTQAARLVASQVAARLGIRVDRQGPDITLLVDFGKGDVVVTSRPLFYYGRYTKPSGISQRRLACEHCRGVGCEKCGNTGFQRKKSVEALLRKKLASFTGSDRMTFTWLGSEDRESRVYQPGRPFVTEVKSPRKRNLPGAFGARFRGGSVSVSGGKVLASKPLRMPSFRFVTKIRATAASKVGPEGLAELRSRFKRAQVRFERPHNRPTTKMVYSVTSTVRGRTLFMNAELDGGLPVKRFVSGELVSPSVSEVLKTQVGCRSFDILRVKETGGFVFAEITRDKEKN